MNSLKKEILFYLKRIATKEDLVPLATTEEIKALEKDLRQFVSDELDRRFPETKEQP